MKKRIIITGGPTNEPIDGVMKITNMSTGRFPVSLGKCFAEMGHDICMVLNQGVDRSPLAEYIEKGNVRIIEIETTDEMLNALESLKSERCDAIIHAAAVGDYGAEFSFLLENLAKELYKDISAGKINSSNDVLALLEDGERYMIDSSSKISSYQKNLTVKLCLTPKIIARLREWYPETMIIGCKLLEDVSKDELFAVAEKLCIKNDVDFIMANDLADLRNGKAERYLVSTAGFTGKVLKNPKDVCDFVIERII